MHDGFIFCTWMQMTFLEAVQHKNVVVELAVDAMSDRSGLVGVIYDEFARCSWLKDFVAIVA